MSDWTAGYIADIGYTFGYYSELNPLRVKLAFLSAGLAYPEMGNACELGFGQGMSANLHAAASVTQWHGTDFNPSQAGFAQELAGISGGGAKLFDEAFADFATRSDLPEFDYIGLHGIWSWISDENRGVIVEFIRRKLKVGGVLYISYNTQPGWASFAPIRHLMTEHAEIIGAEGNGIVSRINGALDFTEKLFATQPMYARANPQIAERIQKIKEQNRHYLAHEYFNRDWLPMHFATMAEWLEPAKLSFACSAHYMDHIDAINLSSEQQQFLAAIPDAMFRETTRDFMVNQQFRRDYWVRGPRKLSKLAQAEQARQLRVLLVQHRADVSLKVTGNLGEATMQDHVYAPILNTIADHQIISLGQIEQATGLALSQILQAALVLIGGGSVVAVQDDAHIAKAKKSCEKLNYYLCNQARGSHDISHLASPVSGGGISIGRFQQLFLLARSQGKKHPAEWAQFAWQILAMQNQTLVKEGQALETEEDNLAELNRQAQTFSEKQLNIFKALGIAW
ncbi:class I SAM-dependent methyltransferase [Janthinobacterium sp. B9-8]|uniref:class I SAM-dependent methyltransferase n=1 Tax=Janthinobacterium sp. B9-8 TaxID=1236179 RepID=UPI00061D2C7D|nr:class I SAM-dependent methyltransferase [Janthinobacterium sp. B9-8]AMC35793.1 methyltransferase [Janthinobacterium sp. B9-8]